MKFTYWSGNKRELEQALKLREGQLEGLSDRLGIDSSKVRVSYNYKDQTNKTKEAKKKVVDFQVYKDIEDKSVERAEVVTYRNGTIAVRVNDSIVRKHISFKLTMMNQLSEKESYEYAADLEASIVASYLALYGVQESSVYKSMEKELEDEALEPLVAMFIGSYIKLSIQTFYKGIRMIKDPYFYENAESMTENDWQDLFDICNYYRLKYSTSFREAMIQMGRTNRLNSRLNSIIDTLEKYLKEYLDREQEYENKARV